MKILIIIVSTLIIWLFLVAFLFTTISFICYALQEIRHDLHNAKRGIKQMLIDLEWAWKHRK